MGLFSLGNLAKLGGFIAAPFTGGASIPIGLGIGGALDAGSQQGRANQAQQEGLDFARQDIESRQPFRDQLFASLQNRAQRPDLSNLFESQNPFARTLGPLNPEAQQTTAPITRQGSGFTGFIGGIGQKFLDDRGLGGLSAAELRQRGVSGLLVDRMERQSQRGGRRSAPLGGGVSAFLEDEERFGGRFEREF